jgi:hypothetical protein
MNGRKAKRLRREQRERKAAALHQFANEYPQEFAEAMARIQRRAFLKTYADGQRVLLNYVDEIEEGE